MTDQTDFERALADRMRARADRTRVDLGHDRIVGGRPARRPATGRPALGPALSFAAVIGLVVTGLVLLVRTGDDTPAPADTFAPVVATAPTTVPPPPDYGVLDDTAGPTLEDHWHAAYGFFLCGQWFQLAGTLEETDAQGGFTNEAFLDTGLHSHDDGMIHIHPYADGGAGDNARLGVFLMNYGVTMGDRFVGFPQDQPMTQELTCDVSMQPISVVVWPDAANPVDPIVVTSGLFDLPLRDGAAITITDTLEGVTPPPWAADLPDLAAIDTGQVAPGDLLGPPPTSPAAFGDLVPCGSVLPPATDFGIEASDLAVADSGARASVILRNTTAGTITVGVATFLVALDADGATASQPIGDGGWLYVDVAAGESLPVTVDAPPALGSVIGAVVPCSGDPGGLGHVAGDGGAYEFVAVLDVGGAVAASDPIQVAVTDGGTVVASSVPSSA